MKHGSLFSGIGGFDLAAEWMGWENVFHCEWNEFGQKVLHHYWPNAESFDDITKTDFTKYANKIDILTGGFPCQPYSMAGKRKGKEDERHLWPEMLRAIREIKPKYIVGENVFGLLNWNGGLVFDEVHTDLEFEGYEVQAVVIPAAAVNAPHGRDRVWFVATNTTNNGYQNGCEETRRKVGSSKQRRMQQFEGMGIQRNATNTKFKSEGSDRGTNDETQRNIRRGNEGDVLGTLRSDGITTNPKECGCRGGMCERCADGERKLLSDEQRRSEMGGEIEGHSGIGDVANANNQSIHFKKATIEHTNGFGQERRLHKNKSKTSIRKQFGQRDARSFESTTWDNFPTQSPICGGDDGLPTELDGITFSKWRNESIKAYGNAIVPQVAYEIFKAIQRTI
jgi:DNA (cytosine-5)-methyltransferase 1